MVVFGGLVAFLGMLLFQRALGLTLRANEARRIPFWRNADIVPAGSIALRAIGAGLLILGTVLLAPAGWYLPLVVALAGPGAALLAIHTHNRRVARSR